MKRRPLAFLLLSALVGAFFGYHEYTAFWIIGSVAFIVALMVSLRSSLARIASFLLFTMMLSALSMHVQKERFIETLALIPQEEATFFGHIVAVSKKENGLLKVVARVASLQKDYSLTVVLHLAEGLAALDLAADQEIHFKGLIKPYEKALSKAHFDAFSFGLSRGIHGSATLSHPSSFFAAQKKGSSYFHDLRQKFYWRTFAVLSPHEAATLLALIMGETDFLSPGQRLVYGDIGAQHLLAVSGLQISALAFMCFWFFTPIFGLCLPKRWSHRAQACSAVFTMMACFWFIGLAGFSASAVRAFLMASCILLSNFIARRIDAFDALYASAFLTLLFWPLYILDVGYLLSYTAVFGLLLAHDASKAYYDRLKPYSIILAYLFMLLISSAAAFLATLPIIVMFFGEFSPWSMMANALLLPWASALQIVAIVMGLLGNLLNTESLIESAGFFSNLIEIFAESLFDVFSGRIYVENNIFICFIAIAVFVFILGIFKRQKILVYMALAAFMTPLFFYQKASELQVCVIPVGQGDATLFSFAGRKHVLIDAGGMAYGSFDPGKQIVVPTLKKRGIDELDILIITHPDPDHIAGAFALFDEIAIKEIWHSGFSDQHPLTKKLKAEAHKRSIPIRMAAEVLGEHQFFSSTLEVLAPQTFTAESYFSELSANDNSMVVRISHGSVALLWPGDIEHFGEQLLLSSQASLKADILKAPHHGSKTSSSAAFIASVQPKHVIYSTGADNRFGFPHDEVTKRFDSLFVKSWNTASHGEIVIKIDGNTIDVQPFRSLKKKTAV